MNKFSETTAGKIANEVAVGLHGQPIDALDDSTKIILLEEAGRVGKEELVDVIISMLPPSLRVPASDAYDLACRAG